MEKSNTAIEKSSAYKLSFVVKRRGIAFPTVIPINFLNQSSVCVLPDICFSSSMLCDLWPITKSEWQRRFFNTIHCVPISLSVFIFIKKFFYLFQEHSTITIPLYWLWLFYLSRTCIFNQTNWSRSMSISDRIRLFYTFWNKSIALRTLNFICAN